LAIAVEISLVTAHAIGLLVDDLRAELDPGVARGRGEFVFAMQLEVGEFRRIGLGGRKDKKRLLDLSWSRCLRWRRLSPTSSLPALPVGEVFAIEQGNEAIASGGGSGGILFCAEAKSSASVPTTRAKAAHVTSASSEACLDILFNSWGANHRLIEAAQMDGCGSTYHCGQALARALWSSVSYEPAHKQLGR